MSIWKSPSFMGYLVLYKVFDDYILRRAYGWCILFLQQVTAMYHACDEIIALLFH